MSNVPRNPLLFIYTGQGPSQIPSNVTHVIVASSVREIPDNAFDTCQDLASVEFSEGLEGIGNDAFHRCSLLTHIKFPSTLREIGDGAFHRCSNLAEVNLPDGMELIGAAAFGKCTSLIRVKIPSTVEEIGESCFEGCHSLVTLELSEGHRAIRQWAFENCRSLTQVRVPQTVVEIGISSFARCVNLVSIELSEGLKRIDSDAFVGCESLGEVFIPSTVTEIGECAFYGCTALASLELPPNLEAIEPYAFEGCAVLTNLYFSSSDMIGERLLTRCSKVRKLLVGVDYDHDYEDDTRDEDVDHALLANAFKERFDGLPMHKLCYLQGYHNTSTTIENIRRVSADKGSVDFLGMTPFHILALSAKPNFHLFVTLIGRYPRDYLFMKDAWGYTALHYLCRNSAPGSTSLLKYTIQLTILERSERLGLKRWRAMFYDKVADYYSSTISSSKSKRIDEIFYLLETYERKEILALLELAIWKAKIDIVENNSRMSGNREKSETAESELDKNFCLVHCGADIIISNVIRFLDKIKVFVEPAGAIRLD